MGPFLVDAWEGAVLRAQVTRDRAPLASATGTTTSR
ncbi:TetR family transcriptional regulator C-terminal domain-containing protein [Streptomyces sp. NPDC051771]